MKWLIFFLCVCVQTCKLQFTYEVTTQTYYQVAGIFDHDSKTQELAFNESMGHITHGSVRIEPVFLRPAKSDSYSVWKELCNNKTMRPIAIIGPQHLVSDSAVRDQCFYANIPHIQATWQPLDPDIELIVEEATEGEGEEEGENQEVEEEEQEENDKETEEINEENDNGEETEEEPTFKKISINFYPDSDEIAFAYGNLLNYYKWENFAVLYEDNFGLMRIQKMLSVNTKKYELTVRKLDPDSTNEMIFKEVANYRESRILLDCHVDRVLQYLETAAQFDLLTNYQHYILVTMDASIVAESLIKLPSNITWYSIAEYENLKNVQHFLVPRIGQWSKTSTSVAEIEVEALMMDDIANHLVKSIGTEKLDTPSRDVCQNTWSSGAWLQNQILKTQTIGVTGNIQFDDSGKRINYTLYINEIYMSDRKTVGLWESFESKLINLRNSSDDFSNQAKTKHFKVISRRAKPYFAEKEPCEEGDDECEDDKPGQKYEGFSVDLVEEIFKKLREEKFNYTYEFVYVEDDSYGKYDKEKKKWDGLLGELLDKRADLAVCDLTITEERKKVVDFSVPFMTLGISILYTQERTKPPGMFSFLNPYTYDVWMCTGIAYCVVSMVLFICARISPGDWENPEPCEKDPDTLENIWSFENCTWLTMGSIMTQGCDILPKAIGTRWICGMWWFFAVIVCQTYIAQLSASMTSALENEPINSVEDLAKQNKILYGAFKSGSTLDFFKNSKDKTFRRMYDNMVANPAVLVSSTEEGEKRVLHSKSKYAFFMESSTIEYKLKRECNLKKVGGELDSKDYGIAMPTNSPFRSQINRAILKLKEQTRLDNIKKKWWNEKFGAKECELPEDDGYEGDLEIKNLIGAFVVLIVGLVFCLFITAAEFMNEVRNIVVKEQVTHKEVIIKELKASLNFFQLQKPVLRNPSRAPSVASSVQSSDKKRSNTIDNFLEFEKEM